jgi:hypothetical protein
VPQPPDDEGALSERERARERHRDRKRETRMVVDNAGVRRVLPALRRRGQKGGTARDQSSDAGGETAADAE